MTKASTKDRPQAALFEDAAKPKPTLELKANVQKGAAPKPGAKLPAPKTGNGVAVVKAQALEPLEPTPGNVFALIAAAARDRDCDPAKMTALYELQKQVMADAAQREYVRAFIALQAELPTIRTDGKIEIKEKDATGKRSGPVQQATPYATFQNIMKTVKPLLQKHGFTLSFEPDVLGIEGRIIMRGHLTREGHSRTCAIPLPLETSGSKNNVQGVGSSISYGKRYATIALLNIISDAKEDADVDGNDPKEVEETVAVITKTQTAELLAAIKDCGVPGETFCKKFGIDRVADLPADKFAEAMTACANFKANRGAHG